MIRTLWLLLGATFIAVGCATQEKPPAEEPKPAPAPAAAAPPATPDPAPTTPAS